MRNPITNLAGHLAWTNYGVPWATWRITPLPYGRRPLKDKQAVRDLHRLLIRSLHGEALLLGIAVTLDPVTVVERQIDGVLLDTCPDLAREAEANLDRLTQLVLGERAYFLSVPLANSGRSRVAAPLRAALGTVADLLGAPRACPPPGELAARARQARTVQQLIPAPFAARPVTVAEQLWLAEHACRRGMLDTPPPDPGTEHQHLTLAGGCRLPEPVLDEGAWSDDDTGVRVRNPLTRRVLKVTDPRAALLGQPASYQCPLVLTDTPQGGLPFPGAELLAGLDDMAPDVDWAIRLRVNSREQVMRENRKALRELNDQFDQRSDETTLGTCDLDLAADLLADYQSIYAGDRLEVEVEHTVILTVAATTAADAMDRATALATLMGSADFRLERPLGALTDLWWATQPGTPTSRVVRSWSLFTTSGQFAALVPFVGTQLGGRRGHVFGLNTSTGRTGIVHLAPGGYPELDKSGSVAFAGELGAGKALAIDTPIPTPTGWARMGDLNPGDEVFDEQGHVTTVASCSPVLVNRTCYEVAFSDGSCVVADAEHLWTTIPLRVRQRQAKRNHVARARGMAATLTLSQATTQLASPGWWRHGHTVSTEQLGQTLTANQQTNHAIPVCGALDLPDADLLVDPYVLGCWLGDGSSSNSQLTTADPEILSLIEACGYTVRPLRARYQYVIGVTQDCEWRPRQGTCQRCGASVWCRYPGRLYCSTICAARAERRVAPPGPTCTVCGVELARGHTGRRCGSCYRRSRLTGQLRELGVLVNKHIPLAYRRASQVQRAALLAGLLDTDGTVAPNGAVEFTTTSQALARDVFELVCSLGLRPTSRERRAILTGRDCGPCWTVSFTTRRQVFALTRKQQAHQQRARTDTPARQVFRYVTDVRVVPSVPVRCIRVTSPSALYLAGSGMIPTHNTVAMKSLCDSIVNEHGQLMAIDKSDDGEWARFAATYTDPVLVDPDEPAWSMDPLRVLGTSAGHLVAASFLTQLLGVSPQETTGITLTQVLDPGYLAEHALGDLQAVMDHLLADCSLPGAGQLGQQMRNYARTLLGPLVFSAGLPPVPADARVLVWRTHRMAQPTSQEIATPHLYRTLTPSKIFGRAYYSLLLGTARRFAFADRTRVSALACDEAYDLFGNPQNTVDLEHFVRQGRRPKALLLVASHDPDHDFGTDTLRELIPTRVVLRQTSDTLARASIRFLGITEDDPEFEPAVDQLRFDTSPADPDQGVALARRGECFLRDAFGAIGTARVLMPAVAQRATAAASTPPKSRTAT